MPEIPVTIPDQTVSVAVTVSVESSSYTGSGVIEVGGTAEVIFGKVYEPGGPIQVGGSAECTFGRVYDPGSTEIEPITVGGTGSSSFTPFGGATAYGYSGTGAVQVSGQATTSFQSGPTTIGGGGLATDFIYDPGAVEEDPAIVVGGAATYSFTSGPTTIGGGGLGTDFIYDPGAVEEDPAIVVSGESETVVIPQIVIFTESLPPIYIGLPYLYQLQATVPFCEWSMIRGQLPLDIFMTDEGIIYGTSTSPFGGSGSSTFKAGRVGYHTAEKVISGTIGFPPGGLEFEMLTLTIPSGFVGVTYVYQLNTVGQAPGSAVVWDLVDPENFPPGLELLGQGIIYGQPTVSGFYTFTLRATDGSTTITSTVTMYIGAYSQLFITTESPLPVAVAGVPYAPIQFEVTGLTPGGGPAVWDVPVGNTPPGQSLSPSGLYGGQPVAGISGAYTFTARVQRPPDLSGTKEFTIQVNSQAHYNYDPASSMAIEVGGSGNASLGKVFTGSGTVFVFGTAASVFTPAVGNNHYGYQGAGGAVVGGSATTAFQPSTTDRTVSFILSDDTTITLNVGDDIVYTGDNAVGSPNCPRGSPGIIMKLVQEGAALVLEIHNPGRNYQTSGSQSVAQPLYWKRLSAHMPGFRVPFGEKYRWVRNVTADDYIMADTTDPKNPIVHTWRAADPVAFARSVDEHCLQGGHTLYYRWLPIENDREQDQMPDASAIARAMYVLDLNLEDINNSVYSPFIQNLIDLYKDQPGQSNPALANNTSQIKVSWLMEPENVRESASSNYPWLDGPTNVNKIKGWNHGMSIFTLMTGLNTNGHYEGNLWWFVRFMLNPNLDTYVNSCAFGIHMCLQSIALGFGRINNTADTYNRHNWVAESSYGYTGAQGDYTLVCQRGQSTVAVHPSKSYDLSYLILYCLRPDIALAADYYARRLDYLKTFNINAFTIGNGSLMLSGERGMALLLRSMYAFYRHCVYTGDTTNATILKNRAEQFIENVLDNQDYPNAYPYPLWHISTSQPNIQPRTGNPAGGESGAGEGHLAMIVKWIFEAGTNNGVTSTDRRELVKSMVAWKLKNVCYGIANDRAEAAYKWTADYSGGTGQPPPPSVPVTPGWPNINNPPVAIQPLGGHEQSVWFFPLFPYMEAWYPGEFIPGTSTLWTTRFERMKNNTYQYYTSSTPWYNVNQNAAQAQLDYWNFPKTHRFLLAGLYLAGPYNP